MRLLGLDYGDKNIGVALSDELGLIAYGLEVIKRKFPNKFKTDLKRIKQIVDEYNVEKIILGFPKSMNNTCGERCEKTLAFKKAICDYFFCDCDDDSLVAKKDIKKIKEVVLWDERLSSVAAGRNLSHAGVNAFKQKRLIDKMAAAFILQGYLDFINSRKNNKSQKTKTQGGKILEYDEINDNDDNIIVMFDEDGNEQKLFVLGSIEDNHKKYLIVSENLEQETNTENNKDDEEEVIILKQTSPDIDSVDADSDDIDYQIVQDDDEIEHVIDLFEKQIENDDE